MQYQQLFFFLAQSARQQLLSNFLLLPFPFVTNLQKVFSYIKGVSKSLKSSRRHTNIFSILIFFCFLHLSRILFMLLFFFLFVGQQHNSLQSYITHQSMPEEKKKKTKKEKRKTFFAFCLPRTTPPRDIGHSVSLPYPLCAKLKLIIPTVNSPSSNCRCPAQSRSQLRPLDSTPLSPTCHNIALSVARFIRVKPQHSRQLLLMPHLPHESPQLQLTCKQKKQRKGKLGFRLGFGSVR